MARGDNKPDTAPKRAVAAGKKLTKAAQDDATYQSEETSAPVELQQKCLDIFRDALDPNSNDAKLLQEVKGHLYNRDFAQAFGKEEYLRVYASRWSPSRALAYLKIFSDISAHFKLHQDGDAQGEKRAVCLGGGAGGELLGLGAWLSTCLSEGTSADGRLLQVDLVDIADWRSVVEELREQLSTPPSLSKYASQAKKDANRALLPASVLDVHFHQLDVLSTDTAKQGELAGLLSRAHLVTFMFTLNEMYSTSVATTQALLRNIIDTMKTGSHVLVVDSPGSYSAVSLSGTEKKYPMHWLLDHTMLRQKNGSLSELAKWEKVLEDDSRWFRLSNELSYPIALENMRCQIHLFRRL